MSQPIPTRDAYEHWARTYDTAENRTRDLDALVLRGTELPLSGARVIEFGAGTGKNTEYLAENAASVLALDFSPAMLERARARGLGEHVTFAEQDITQPWPAGDASADLVVGNLVLEHVEDLSPVYAEIGRVLKPGGILFISELHPDRQARGSQAGSTVTASRRRSRPMSIRCRTMWRVRRRSTSCWSGSTRLSRPGHRSTRTRRRAFSR